MAKLVLLRHGESIWNKKNIFTGWVDIPLSEKGIQQALQTGEQLKEMKFSAVFTSYLVRAQMTAFLALSKVEGEVTPAVVHDEEHEKRNEWYQFPKMEDDTTILPVYLAEALNERFYGDLQGKNKDAVLQEVGQQQFHAWRRSYDGKPPEGESLAETVQRVIPYFEKEIISRVIKGENILVVAHGNTIRGIVKYIDHISDEEIAMVEIPLGEPMIYQFEEGMWGKIAK